MTFKNAVTLFYFCLNFKSPVGDDDARGDGEDENDSKRHYLYYLAIGNARIKEYSTALKFVRALLQVRFFFSFLGIKSVQNSTFNV